MSNVSQPLKILVAIATILFLVAMTWYLLESEPNPPIPEMTEQEKKARFKQLIVPVVNEVHNELATQYRDVKKLVESSEDPDSLTQLKQKYKVSSNAQLLAAIKPHPRSITLAQAAMESAWATSRFFHQANNVFGVWSFDKDEPRLAAKQKRGSKTIYVKKYPSLKASIRDYYRTLARHRAYKDFRKLKMQTNDPLQLVKKLDKYSEKGAAYGRELSGIIKFNRFEQYDR